MTDSKRSRMLDNHADLNDYLRAHPDLAPRVCVIESNKIGLLANVGISTKLERFDFPFNGEAFYDLLLLDEKST